MRYPFLLAIVSLGLSACSGSDHTSPTSGQVNVDGQVSAGSIGTVSYYQAARFLEQASWGPTPTTIAEVQQLGIHGWIDRQFALPPTTFNAPQFVINYDMNNQAQQRQAHGWLNTTFFDGALGGADQLRQRVSWAFFNFIPIGGGPPAYGKVEYREMLQRNSLGNFKDLLREVTLHPTMGVFLNNDQNEASRPNENYARELMQLFSVGLVLLNPDGTTKRDGRGAPLETYSQQDVKEATRALSGWQKQWETNLPQSNFGNFGKRMIAKSWDGAHDRGAKRVLGRDIPAGQSAEADLESLLDILVDHPNTAPFVARRLIQSMVSSDPSPAYMTRISNVFVQTRGDIKAVVRAILLDPEARAGDNPSLLNQRVGKIKEPLLSQTMVLRAMGCRISVRDRNNPESPIWANQTPYEAPSVFGYFAPNHKTAETLKAAPEEKLLGASEFNRRLQGMSWNLERPEQFRSAGCQIDVIERAASQSDDALITFISERFMRGAMPPTLRLTMQTLLRERLSSEQPLIKFATLMGIATGSAHGGVVR